MSKQIEVSVLVTVRVADASNRVYGKEILAGTTDVIDAELLDGLKAAGYVTEVATETAAPTTDPTTVEIPANWAAMKPKKIIAIAKSLGAEASTVEEAVAAVEAELTRRAAV